MRSATASVNLRGEPVTTVLSDIVEARIIDTQHQIIRLLLLVVKPDRDIHFKRLPRVVSSGRVPVTKLHARRQSGPHHSALCGRQSHTTRGFGMWVGVMRRCVLGTISANGFSPLQNRYSSRHMIRNPACANAVTTSPTLH
jgi:hypothetical protein